MNPEIYRVAPLMTLGLSAVATSEARHDRSGDGSVNRDIEMKQMAGGPAIGAGNRHERRFNRAMGR